jgi:TRAP-type C4-dicarboxylate transport system permease small subunit
MVEDLESAGALGSTPPQGGRWLFRGIHRISWLLNLVAGFLTVAILIMIVTDVGWRILAGRSVRGVFEYSEVILATLVVLSLAHAQAIRGHITVDFLVVRLTATARRWVALLTGTLMTLLLAAMTWGSWMVTAQSIARGEYRTGLARVPVWPTRLAITVGLVLLTLEFLITTYEDFKDDRHPPQAGL